MILKISFPLRIGKIFLVSNSGFRGSKFDMRLFFV